MEARLSSQIEDIKEEELGAIFKAYSKTTKDKVDKVDKTKLLELLAKEVIRIGLSIIPTIQEPIAAIPKLDFKVINLPNIIGHPYNTLHTSTYYYGDLVNRGTSTVYSNDASLYNWQSIDSDIKIRSRRR